MSRSTRRLVIAIALTALFAAPALAEPRMYTGSIKLEFPGSGATPIAWDIPISGIGSYQPGTATNTSEAFVLSGTNTVNIGTTTSVMGSVANPFQGGGTFDTGQMQEVKLRGGFIPVNPAGTIQGLQVAVASLDLEGLTSASGVMTYNHPLLRIGTSFASVHPGAFYLTTSTSLSATGTDGTWSATLHSLGFGGGDLNLVTPVSLTTSAGGTLAGTGRLELTFAPEPGMALMLVTGVGVLCVLGRQRRR